MTYRGKQISEIAVDDGGFYRIQIGSDNGHGMTNWMNISHEELNKVLDILDEEAHN